ncbi:hypothetical protein B9Z55_011356 [Caenorhabditis nigoni]|uniref:Uncharacterized protein n=1 Tax=Caenorhabditis nigoni TaxID=1611254 RepID=A0A2G5UJS5_9PELO|nr:hypothetical protein B9Z55_011356 [Caenorhabditis nigoni]
MRTVRIFFHKKYLDSVKYWAPRFDHAEWLSYGSSFLCNLGTLLSILSSEATLHHMDGTAFLLSAFGMAAYLNGTVYGCFALHKFSAVSKSDDRKSCEKNFTRNESME